MYLFLFNYSTHYFRVRRNACARKDSTLAHFSLKFPSFFHLFTVYISLFRSFCPQFLTKRRRNGRDKTRDICAHHSKFQIVSQNSFSLSFHNRYLRSTFLMYLLSFLSFSISIPSPPCASLFLSLVLLELVARLKTRRAV